VNARPHIIELALQGVVPAEIAAETGTQVRYVYHVISTARRAGHDIPQFPRGRNSHGMCGVHMRFNINQRTASALEIEATARGVSSTRLAKTLIETIARDGIWNAVLDE
jgi:hypothetical protein